MRAKHLRPLQVVLNAAARVISRRGKYDHISDIIRDQLYWLSIVQRIECKLCRLVFKCLHLSGPKNLSEMRQYVSDMPGRKNLVELRIKTPTYGSRSFAFSAPKTWNSLPPTTCATTRCPYDNSVGISKAKFSIAHTRL